MAENQNPDKDMGVVSEDQIIEINKKRKTRTQSEFLAEAAGISEEDVFVRVASLKQQELGTEAPMSIEQMRQ